MKNVLTTVKLNPITLVDCIVAPVGRMANVKIKQLGVVTDDATLVVSLTS